MLGHSSRVEVFVKGTGTLDLVSNRTIRQQEFKIDELSITEGGDLLVSQNQPLVARNIVLNAADGGIDATIYKKGSLAPIQIKDGGKLDYKKGVLNVDIPVDPEDIDPEGDWNIVSGTVSNEKELAQNKVVTINGTE